MNVGTRFSVSDVLRENFLRFPAALLANPAYKTMSCEAKIVYMLLLNRMTLSQRNGWYDSNGQVYLIMTREEAAGLLNISYKKMIAVFKELTGKRLIEEQRQGRGYPNLIYVLKTDLSNDDASDFSDDYNGGPGPDKSDEANTAHQDLSKRQFMTCPKDSSRPDETTGQDLSKIQPSKIENSYIENSQIENNFDRHTDRVREQSGYLEDLFDRCELYNYDDDERLMFENAIERLYYSSHYRVGGVNLPQALIHKHLDRLDADRVSSTYNTIRQNDRPVKNTTAYLMSVLFNCIAEETSDLLVCLPPEFL